MTEIPLKKLTSLEHVRITIDVIFLPQPRGTPGDGDGQVYPLLR